MTPGIWSEGPAFTKDGIKDHVEPRTPELDDLVRRAFIAYPDLVTRIRTGPPSAEAPQEYWYGGDGRVNAPQPADSFGALPDRVCELITNGAGCPSVRARTMAIWPHLWEPNRQPSRPRGARSYRTH